MPKGITRHTVTLHVGAGTFLPVKSADTGEPPHACRNGAACSAATAAALNEARARGGRIVAVGTTSLRLLESAADEAGKLHSFAGETSLFITPGYRFRAVDLLMTNFHLPRSTLFMLVSAFSGRETMLAAYRHAIDSRLSLLLLRRRLPALSGDSVMRGGRALCRQESLFEAGELSRSRTGWRCHACNERWSYSLVAR